MASFYDTYSPIAIDAARTYGVPTELFLWQIGKESGWNPNAQNPNSSAGGIAQFIDSTAKWKGVDKWDPTASLYAAAQYDAQLAGQCGGWLCALKNYGTTSGSSALQNEASQVLNQSGSQDGTQSGCGLDWSCWDKKLFPYAAWRSADELAANRAQSGSASSFIDGLVSRVPLIVLGIVFLAGAIYLYKQ